MKIIKKFSKKLLCVIMTLIIIMTTFIPSVSTFAASVEKCKLTIKTSSNYEYMNNWAYPDSRHGIHLAKVKDGTHKGEVAYCIEFGKDMGDDGQEEEITELNDIPAWQDMKVSQRNGITRATIYGYPNFNYGVSNEAAQVATQFVVWEYSQGYRTSADGDNPTAGLNGTSTKIENAIEAAGFDVRQQYYKSGVLVYDDVKTAYKGILNGIKNHLVVPSFKSDTVELEWNSSNNRYEATISDANKVLSNFKISCSNSNVKFSQSGNKLTIYTTSTFNNTLSVSMDKTCASVGADIGFIPPNNNENQSLVGTLCDPVTASFKVKVASGNAKIIKVSEDGKVKGIRFTLSGNGITKSDVTDGNGEIVFENLPVGTYTVTEESIDKYEPQKSKTVTVVGGETKSVSFSNTLKRSDIQVIKVSEDNYNEGHKFHLYGISLSGAKVDEYATTNSSGVATFKDILIGSGYTLEEVDTAIRYVIPDSQIATVEWKKVNKYTFDNILKKFRVKVVKEDIEKGKAQGDASLAGATYGLYKGDTLMATYSTDSNASFITDYFVCADDWTIKEISSSEGYLVNGKAYKVGAKPELYTVEYNTTDNKVQEQVIKGKIAIIKHTDDGSTQIETPEKNAEFQIYLKSSGSYAKADSDERDTLICDEDGFASSKLLPYGVYTVHQTKGWDGREKIKDFDVYINKDGKTYKFLINNSNFCSYLKVVKNDKETNKPIAYAGAAFEIFDDEGHRITMQYTYPKVTSIHTFYTNSEGYLITPEMLPYGEYTLVEVTAPYGYILDDTPIPFSIKQENSSTDTGVTVVKVNAKDMAQKGVIEITKTGEIFSTVNESANIYTPIFETGNLKNAVFQVYAGEDIYTLDGTLRAYNGELVDEIITGTNGIAKSKELYLGKYVVIEKTAPENYVNNNEQYNVELEYAGQNVSVTSTALSVYNERQKVQLSLLKTMERNEIYNIGNNNEILSVQFGIYAGEDIKAADGSVIPTDSLITFANCDKDGNIAFSCDLPIGFKWYAKEIATDEHYIISDTKYDFATEYQGESVSVIDIIINNGEVILNNLKYGQLNGLKVDDDGNALAGALIGIFTPNTKEFTKDNAIQTVTSGDDGTFYFYNVPYGEWIVREIIAPTGYVLDTTQHHIYITDNDVSITMLIENKLIKGDLEISKTDVSSGEALANVGFRIYDADKNIIAEGITDNDGKCTFENLRYGDYFYQEYSCDDAYVLDDSLYPFSISEDGVIVKAEITNRMKQGSIVIHKTDASTGKALANVGFRIYDADKNIIAEGKTDKNGNCTFENLVYGTYYYQEYSCDSKYALDDTLYKFVISEDGQIVKAEMTNELKPVPKPPKTADESNKRTLLTIISASALALLGVAYAYLRKRKQEPTTDEGGNDNEC